MEDDIKIMGILGVMTIFALTISYFATINKGNPPQAPAQTVAASAPGPTPDTSPFSPSVVNFY